MKKIIYVLIIAILTGNIARPEEGMWIPLLLKKYKIEEMQKAGFKLTAEDVYSVNQACLKDAIVIFGGGCTGELISGEGLLITNHHCGYGNIQRHSTVEHDYLTDGFWAMNRSEELPNPGLSVTFLIRIEDVTEACLTGVKEGMVQADRDRIIQENSRKVQAESVKGTSYSGRVSSFFGGNQFFLFVYESYNDVRLVGAPPSAIGKFGGETDNWIWPRHTGDFSLFRIYAGPDNKPAAYSPSNVPYKPKKFLPISLKGVEKGDFTMVFGYPGRTTEYIPSFVIENQVKYTIPASVDLRTRRLEIIERAMEISPLIRIQYSAKKSGIANTWKKNQGVLLGLNRISAIDRKKEFEDRFQAWVMDDAARKSAYGDLLSRYRKIVTAQAPFELANTYAREAGEAAEIINFSGRFSSLISMASTSSPEELQKAVERMRSGVAAYFKDYDSATDEKLLAALLEAYSLGIDVKFQPALLVEMSKKYGGDFKAYAAYIFKNSAFSTETKVSEILGKFGKGQAKKLANDPALLMFKSLAELQKNVISPGLSAVQAELPELQRLYMKAQMEMQPDKLFYPDANSTIRITYGKVNDFNPSDGIQYKHVTTLDGIIEKDNPEIYDYRVPEKLKQLYAKKDFGAYEYNHTVPVCFIASNHTSGGNSGSPVINAEGQLIGINFDRNWEGTMSDIFYDPDLCRNISLDIRYALFIIDKFAGAGHLIKEMELVR
ncbi:MAG: peptidase S46 [Bacteroidetes bacterium GWF2_49_14]|nr:MAG: peptidase S46 [Bacteroidetes bacterium GWF2_49_14]HBB90549.1 serine protease [Bacteroidales bacterium]